MIRKLFGALGVLAIVAALSAAHLQASDGRQPVDSSAVAAGEIVVGESTGHIQGTHTPTISGSVTVGLSGTAVSQINVYTQTLTPTVVSPGACDEQTFTVTGVITGDVLTLAFAGELSGSTVPTTVRPSGGDTVAVTFCNVSNANASAETGTYSILGIRS